MARPLGRDEFFFQETSRNERVSYIITVLSQSHIFCSRNQQKQKHVHFSQQQQQQQQEKRIQQDIQPLSLRRPM
jgi:hypothetical protein